jgi:hypothetical protein
MRSLRFFSNQREGGVAVRCEVHIAGSDRAVSLQLRDFNNLRWMVAALRFNAALRKHLHRQGKGPAVQVVDSRALRASIAAPPDKESCVVLWDGLNSLIELHSARPDLAARDDVSYAYVGGFADVEAAFPVRSLPLYPPAPDTEATGRRPTVDVPAWVGWVGAARTRARTWKNTRQSPKLHRRLQAGGCAVFCGLIRPNTILIDGFFRGTSLGALRTTLSHLEGFDWTGPLPAVRTAIASAYDACQAARPTLAADWAALYAVLGVMHRMGCLAELRALTPHLVVNEYGLHVHLDPYDTPAYKRNLFIDFGSVRGPDALYPRTVDLLLNAKSVEPLRFLMPQQRLAEMLTRTDGSAFLLLCAAQARQVLARLAA